jgi:hypothetical protein
MLRLSDPKLAAEIDDVVSDVVVKKDSRSITQAGGNHKAATLND